MIVMCNTHARVKTVNAHLAIHGLEEDFDFLPLLVGSVCQHVNDGFLIRTWQQPHTGTR